MAVSRMIRIDDSTPHILNKYSDTFERRGNGVINYFFVECDIEIHSILSILNRLTNWIAISALNCDYL